MRKVPVWVCVLAATACGGGHNGQPRPIPRVSRAGAATSPAPSAPAASAAEPSEVISTAPPRGPGPPASSPPQVERSFQAHLAEHRDLTFPDLERELSLGGKPDPPLSFNPDAVRYAPLAFDKLSMSPEERATFRRDGAVNVDHAQRYSMASAYYAVFTRDLPVLVTTDSILHALHRSYDAILERLEVAEFTSTIAAMLERSHGALLRAADNPATSKLRDSAGDVDVYLTVARNLLSDAAPKDGLRVRSVLGNDAKVKALLKKIGAQKLEVPPAFTDLYGGRRSVDYSQFKPRGHYTESPGLSRYFQALMWLGRADTGFVLAPPDENSGIEADAERELRGAALLALSVGESGELDRFESMGQVIDFLVGSSDSLTVRQMLKALAEAGIRGPSQLERTSDVLALQAAVSEAGRQQIRSQVVVPPENAEEEAKVPQLFQLFGQRFLLDSFVLSRVVYDSISFQGRKVKRMMPTGLDVMAALGNDEATRLLRPELEKFPYAGNLLAVRRTVDDVRPEEFEENVYGLWLDALRKLDDVPSEGSFPEAMKRTPFRRKQLQTELASWAEPRHDTMLYGKQSYSAGILCEYPEGYVEPYPEFFARLALLSEEAGRRLGAANASDSPYTAFFRNFGDTMKYLELLARKELQAKPFTAEEAGFLKKTIDASGGGCGGPTYDGWYARLFFDGSPEEWKPTVSDVHTDPTTGQVLEEAVGDANFLVVAVDNQKDRAVYVGPVYSYYEFTRAASDRMTDEQWQELVRKKSLPPRPSWWRSAFPAKALERTLGGGKRPKETDPRELASERLMEEARRSKTPYEQKRLYDEARKLREAARKPPLPSAPHGS